MSNGIITALNINADKIAESGDVNFIMFNASICGIASVNIAGMIAKYFAIDYRQQKLKITCFVRVPTEFSGAVPGMVFATP